ncbi:hypothetical protein GCM10027413_27000 [Conyzicola nivalis]|uniref:Uncharacterized protein n=1 Tax=Conyzicola nivalis TaxID=1477021 RepID=A0A916STE1_9MICO|nr:hypothetical protein [Conyzicola nivalis]GGB15405.1 hypothetical protein GCM10010979_32510 [Conyzicola nivalis]
MRAHPVAAALGLVAAQLGLAAVLTSQILAVAYRMPGVGSLDELGRLGSGPGWAFAAAWAPAAVAIPITLILLAQRFRRRAWTLPAVGMLVSVAGWLWAVSTFEQPTIVGG